MLAFIQNEDREHHSFQEETVLLNKLEQENLRLQEMEEDGHLQVLIYHLVEAMDNHPQEEIYKERLFLEAEY